jgi:hypothetical protein
MGLKLNMPWVSIFFLERYSFIRNLNSDFNHLLIGISNPHFGLLSKSGGKIFLKVSRRMYFPFFPFSFRFPRI